MVGRSDGAMVLEKHQTDVAAGQALQAARSYVAAGHHVDCERIDHNSEGIFSRVRPASSKISMQNAHLRQLLADNRWLPTECHTNHYHEQGSGPDKFIDQSVSNRNSLTPQTILAVGSK